MRDVDRQLNACEIKIVQKVLNALTYEENQNVEMFVKTSYVGQMLFVKPLIM